MANIAYNPKEGKVVVDGVEEELFCGSDITEEVAILLSFRAGRTTLQEAYSVLSLRGGVKWWLSAEDSPELEDNQ